MTSVTPVRVRRGTRTGQTCQTGLLTTGEACQTGSCSAVATGQTCVGNSVSITALSTIEFLQRAAAVDPPNGVCGGGGLVPPTPPPSLKPASNKSTPVKTGFRGRIYVCAKKAAKCLEPMKTALPHVILLTVVILYTVGGSFLFTFIEAKSELDLLREKTETLRTIYETIANSSHENCFYQKQPQELLQASLLAQLKEVSYFHDNTPFRLLDRLLNPSSVNYNEPSWDFKKSMVYALTLTTTTGFNELSTRTRWGKMISVLYAMFGIPLMFVTAADVGKLLSELVTSCWDKYQKHKQKSQSRCSNCRKKQTEDLPKCKQIMRQVTSNRKQSYLYHTMPVEVPGVLIAVLAMGYICAGGSMFMHYHGWSFIESVHFAFDAMTSITLGFTPVDSYHYLAMLTLFLIFGLSVITMCLDLARLKLRNLFVRLHYFGYKMAENLQQQEKMKLDPEVLSLAAAMQELREQGYNDTLLLLDYWKCKKHAEMELQRLLAAAYKPAELKSIPFIDQRTGLQITASIEDLENFSSIFYPGSSCQY